MEIEFVGIDELIREIEKIEEITEEMKDEALIAGADLLKERTQEAVYSYGLKPKSGKAPSYIDRTNPKDGEILVGNTSDGYYLYFHENGFYNVRAKRFIPPKPFASVAYETSKSAILDEYVKVFRKGLGIR